MGKRRDGERLEAPAEKVVAKLLKGGVDPGRSELLPSQLVDIDADTEGPAANSG